MSLLDNINPDTIGFVNRREFASARQALQAMNNVVALKNSLGLLLSHETYTAVEELERRVFDLRWATLEPRSPQNDPKEAPQAP